jgi:hypothetical protein
MVETETLIWSRHLANPWRAHHVLVLEAITTIKSWSIFMVEIRITLARPIVDTTMASDNVPLPARVHHTMFIVESSLRYAAETRCRRHG